VKVKVNGESVTVDKDEATRLLRQLLRKLGMHCVYPECCNTRRTRGLCHGHYQEWRRLARTDEKRGTDRCKSDADLEAEGLLLGEGTGGGSKAGKSEQFLRVTA
jgi:hypothetical protein